MDETTKYVRMAVSATLDGWASMLRYLVDGGWAPVEHGNLAEKVGLFAQEMEERSKEWADSVPRPPHCNHLDETTTAVNLGKAEALQVWAASVRRLVKDKGAPATYKDLVEGVRMLAQKIRAHSKDLADSVPLSPHRN